MRLQPIISAFGLLASVNAGLLRFGCAQLTVQRLDPLVNPGANPSPHLHQIIGGVRNSYGETYVQLLIKPELIQRDDGPYQTVVRHFRSLIRASDPTLSSAAKEKETPGKHM